VDRGIPPGVAGRTVQLLLIEDVEPEDDQGQEYEEEHRKHKREFGQRLAGGLARIGSRCTQLAHQ
jgi:hypothetical protein